MTLLYSSEKGYLCPKCQEALDNCRCSKGPVRVHLEKNGRGGKVVSVISNIPRKDLEKVAKELKSSLGTGGSVKDQVIEIQGDKISSIKTWLTKKGYLLFLICCLSSCIREEKVVFPKYPNLEMIGFTYCENLRKPGSNLICSLPLEEEAALELFREAVPTFTTPPNNQFMALTFWDEQMNRMAKPYVARLELRNENIYIYYKSDESEHLDKEVKIVPLERSS